MVVMVEVVESSADMDEDHEDDHEDEEDGTSSYADRDDSESSQCSWNWKLCEKNAWEKQDPYWLEFEYLLPAACLQISGQVTSFLHGPG